MRVLGIDPGTATTGYGIIDVADGEMTMVTYGAITTAAKTPMPRRLAEIYEQVTALVKEFQPDAVGVEEVFFGRNITTGISVSQARGVVLLALHQAGLSIGEYSPAKVKSAVAGYGNADKAQIQLMVRHLLELDETPKPDDAADGLAIAITHYHYLRFDMMTG